MSFAEALRATCLALGGFSLAAIIAVVTWAATCAVADHRTLRAQRKALKQSMARTHDAVDLARRLRAERVEAHHASLPPFDWDAVRDEIGI